MSSADVAAALASALCVGVMGFAIQRGGTCAVAAVEEVLTERRARRLLAMLEASLWVAGGLALARLGHFAGAMPAAPPVGGWTVAGGALLGIGAWVNRACVFGAVARLGSGEWVYLATPLGFYLGCLSIGQVLPSPATAPAVPMVPAGHGGPLAAVAFGVLAAWRMRPALAGLQRPDRVRWLRQSVWSPHAATVVIGVSFVIVLLLAGRWAYTDVLADLARRMRDSLVELAHPMVLLAALYLGALTGGLTAGRWHAAPQAASAWMRCLAGGILMGWGSLLIPGSNDSLILIGIPLLQPHAWLALASMFGAIAAALQVGRAWRPRPAEA